jgi:hypothetical protein
MKITKKTILCGAMLCLASCSSLKQSPSVDAAFLGAAIRNSLNTSPIQRDIEPTKEPSELDIESLDALRKYVLYAWFGSQEQEFEKLKQMFKNATGFDLVPEDINE